MERRPGNQVLPSALRATDIALEEYIRSALAAFPTASPNEASVIGEGQLCVAIRVGQIVFRFPRHSLGVERLQTEVALIEKIRPRVSGRVPEIIQLELELPLGSAFVAHRLIPGEVLTVDGLRTIPPATYSKVANDVALFLRELHGLAGIIEGIVDKRSASEYMSQLEDEAGRLLYPRMGPLGRERAVKELSRARSLSPRDPVLCHTDIGGNIVFDEDTEQLGYIDFGSTMISDPILDAASLSVLGDDFLLAGSAAYPLLGDLVSDAAVVRDTFVLQDALYGARQEDWAYVDEVLRDYDA